jgi:hypothetical protein
MSSKGVCWVGLLQQKNATPCVLARSNSGGGGGGSDGGNTVDYLHMF